MLVGKLEAEVRTLRGEGVMLTEKIENCNELICNKDRQLEDAAVKVAEAKKVSVQNQVGNLTPLQ